jgi:hypothetical protein
MTKQFLIPIATAFGGYVASVMMSLGLMVAWVSIGHYFECTTETSLLSYIGLMATALVSHFTVQTVKRPTKPDEKDCYVVTDDSYRWDITLKRHRGTAIKADLGGTTVAFDSFAAAKVYYQQTERAHDPMHLDGRTLSHHTMLGYDEQETKLWVVRASSKQVAYDKVWYDESRRIIGGDGRSDHVLLATNNEHRRRTYVSWWYEVAGNASPAI